MRIFLCYWLITGLIALGSSLCNIKAPENAKKLEKLARDYEMTIERTKVMMHTGSFVLGFILLPVILLIKLKEFVTTK